MEANLEVRSDYVLATFTGPLSLPELVQAVRECIDAAADAGLNLMLFDCFGVEGFPSTRDRMELGESGAVHALGKVWKTPPKMAFVGNFPLTNGLGAMVAINRGVNAKTFLATRQALDWLGVPRSLADG